MTTGAFVIFHAALPSDRNPSDTSAGITGNRSCFPVRARKIRRTVDDHPRRGRRLPCSVTYRARNALRFPRRTTLNRPSSDDACIRCRVVDAAFPRPLILRSLLLLWICGDVAAPRSKINHRLIDSALSCAPRWQCWSLTTICWLFDDVNGSCSRVKFNAASDQFPHSQPYTLMAGDRVRRLITDRCIEALHRTSFTNMMRLFAAGVIFSISAGSVLIR